MTDNNGMQRIGRNDADSPAGRDWREDLHGQRREDDRKKIPQPPPHRSIPPPSGHQLITRINECRDLGSGQVPRSRCLCTSGTGIIPQYGNMRWTRCHTMKQISICFRFALRVKTGSDAFDAASGGETPIVSQIARNLNNRCRKW